MCMSALEILLYLLKMLIHDQNTESYANLFPIFFQSLG